MEHAVAATEHFSGAALRAACEAALLAELLDELNALEKRAGHISVPLSYADELYALRSHIHMVRKRLQGQAPQT